MSNAQYQGNNAVKDETRNQTVPLLPTNRAPSPIAPGPVVGYATKGGSDLNYIQQAEPANLFEVDPNIIDTGQRPDNDRMEPTPVQQQPVPVGSDMSDPYFGYSTTSTTTIDPAASEQPMDMAIATSPAEAQRLQGYSGGTLYQAGASLAPTVGSVVGGSDDGGQSSALATLYQNIGTVTTGEGQDPPGAGQIAGTALLQANTEALPSAGAPVGLVLTTGPNNPMSAQTSPGGMNPLVLALMGLFVIVTIVKGGRGGASASV